MPALKDHAHVLRLFEHGNSSLVAVMLGRSLGQFRMLARGVLRWPKKGFEGGLDLLARGEVIVYPRPGDNLWIFSQWDEHPRPVPPASEEVLAAVSYLCELTEALTRQMAGAITHLSGNAVPDDAGERMFELLGKAHDALATGSPPGAVVLAYTLKALEIEGVLPALNECHRCGKGIAASDGPGPLPVWMSFDGFTCRACYAKASAIERPRGDAERRSLEQGVWLPPKVHHAMLMLHTASRVPRLSGPGAELLSRGLVFWVHGALEHDLRTLAAAMKLIRGLAIRRENGR